MQALLEGAGISLLLAAPSRVSSAASERWLLTSEGDRVPADLLVAGQGGAAQREPVTGGAGSPGSQTVDEHMRTAPARRLGGRRCRAVAGRR